MTKAEIADWLLLQLKGGVITDDSNLLVTDIEAILDPLISEAILIMSRQQKLDESNREEINQASAIDDVVSNMLTTKEATFVKKGKLWEAKLPAKILRGANRSIVSIRRKDCCENDTFIRVASLAHSKGLPTAYNYYWINGDTIQTNADFKPSLLSPPIEVEITGYFIPKKGEEDDIPDVVVPMLLEKAIRLLSQRGRADLIKSGNDLPESRRGYPNS